MPHPYDASTKYLVQTWLADWLPLCGRTTSAHVEIIDADLATVTAAADRVLRVHEQPPWLLNLELQSSRDPDLAANLLAYNVLLERRHRMLVRTLVVLLRRSADGELSGLVERRFPEEAPHLVFRYQVVRVWQEPVETFLNGGLGVLPLAPLGAVTAVELPAVVSRIDQRLRAEATPEEAGRLWTATDVLMGLRFPREFVAQLLRGVHGMKDSDTYQAIIEEGMAKGVAQGTIHSAQEMLLRFGQRKFGPPDEITESSVRNIADLDRLYALSGRIWDVATWDELLASPQDQ